MKACGLAKKHYIRQHKDFVFARKSAAYQKLTKKSPKKTCTSQGIMEEPSLVFIQIYDMITVIFFFNYLFKNTIFYHEIYRV
jgi:hypothetical protein